MRSSPKHNDAGTPSAAPQDEGVSADSSSRSPATASKSQSWRRPARSSINPPSTSNVDTNATPILRVYEGCGRALTGEVEGATLVKMHRKPQVSFLVYPDFDRQ